VPQGTLHGPALDGFKQGTQIEPGRARQAGLEQKQQRQPADQRGAEDKREEGGFFRGERGSQLL